MTVGMGAPRTVMVVGAGRWQVPLIETVRRLGHRCVATDRDPSAPGASRATFFEAVGMKNPDGLREVARKHRVDAIVTDQSDRAVAAVARLNEGHGTRGIGSVVARLFTDKEATRRALQGVVAMPRWSVVRSLAQAESAASTIGLPVVVKPPADQASAGVTLVRRPAGVAAAFAAAREVSGDDRVLVEEFVAGPEVTVESFSSGGRCRVLGISEKGHYDHLPCVARRLAWPPRMSERTLDAIRGSAVRAVEELGLAFGIGHAEFRLRDGVPHLIEVAARGGGSGIACTVVPHISGFDVTAALVREALGCPIPPSTPVARSAVLGFFDFGRGRVRTVVGRDRAARVAHRFELDISPGDSIGDPTSDTDRTGRYVILGVDRDDVDAKLETLHEALTVDLEEVA